MAPILVLAVLVQILLPVVGGLLTAVAASDPLHGLAICRTGSVQTPADRPSDDHRAAHDCALCQTCMAVQPMAPAPDVAALDRRASAVVVRASARWPTVTPARPRSIRRARAPPSLLDG